MANLKDFRNDPTNMPGLDDEENMENSEYHQEINTLKIEKLSNRVTILSVITPCLICALLIFVYLDMKERVGDVDMTKKLAVENLSRQMEEKFNALDLRIAKNKFEYDQQLPLLAKKEQSLENQVAKMSVAKADAMAIKTAMAALDKKIKKNSTKNKSTLAAMEAMKVKLKAAMTLNNTKVKEQATKLKEEITIFKEKYDARLKELSVYVEQIGQLRKAISLLDKKLKGMELDGISGKQLDKRFKQVQQSLEKKIQALDKKLKQQSSVNSVPVKRTNITLKKNKSTNAKPIPQLDTGNNTPESISQETLTE